MSKNLTWQPKPQPPKKERLDALEVILARYLWNEGDKYNCLNPIEVDKNLIPFLEGVAFGSADVHEITRIAAERLINAIKKYDVVILEFTE